MHRKSSMSASLSSAHKPTTQPSVPRLETFCMPNVAPKHSNLKQNRNNSKKHKVGRDKGKVSLPPPFSSLYSTLYTGRMCV